MSDEIDGVCSGWTVDTLKYHVDAQMADLAHRIGLLQALLDERHELQEKALVSEFTNQREAMRTAVGNASRAVETAMIATEKAVAKAEMANEKRFESVNEFRGQLADQATRFISRDEYLAVQQRFDEKVDTMQRTMDKHEGRGLGLNAGWGYLIGTMGLLATILGIVFALTGRQ